MVVNHALLMSDLVRGGGLIPEYKHLIIDEAHNLEDAATRQLGFQVMPGSLDQALEPHARLITELRLALLAEDLASAIRQQGEEAVGGAEGSGPRLKDLWTRLWGRRGPVVQRAKGAQRRWASSTSVGPFSQRGYGRTEFRIMV